MAVREGKWYEGDQLLEAEGVAEVAARVLLDEERLIRCVLCRVEQPDDVRWSHYAMELKRKTDGVSQDVEYTCCPSCEPRLDRMLFDGDGGSNVG